MRKQRQFAYKNRHFAHVVAGRDPVDGAKKPSGRLSAHRLDKGLGHSAANDQVVDLSEQVFNNGDLG